MTNLYENKIKVVTESDIVTDAFYDEHQGVFEAIDDVIQIALEELGNNIKARLAEIGVDAQVAVD